MNRDEQEMALWREAYWDCRVTTPEYRARKADDAVAEFRLRYPPQPAGNGDPDTSSILGLLEAITGDSAFTGFGDSMQSRIYAAADALRRGRPAAPDAVWYDEPPLPKDGTMLACWIEGHKSPGVVVWNGDEWRMYVAGNRYWDPLAGRRVCPIAKPPEPKT